MKLRLFAPFLLLLLTIVWGVLAFTGALRPWAAFIGARAPSGFLVIAVAMIPLLGVLGVIDLEIDWRLRIAAGLALLVLTPLLPVVYESHPLPALLVTVLLFVVAYSTNPLLRRLRPNKNGK